MRPEGVLLYGGIVDSNQALVTAIDHVLAMGRRPDLVVLTGDLVDEGRPEEYAMLRKILVALPIPYLVIPGNHDDRDNLRDAFADHAYLPRHGPLQCASHKATIGSYETALKGCLPWISR